MFLPESLKAWDTMRFADALKRELAPLLVGCLPLQQAVTRGSHVPDEVPTLLVMSAVEAGAAIEVKMGVFFSSIIAGCSCADDPTPVEALTEYCELRVTIDRVSGAAVVAECPEAE